MTTPATTPADGELPAKELDMTSSFTSNNQPQVVVSRFVTNETDAYLDKLRFAASEAIRTFEDAGDAMSWSPTIDAIERLKGILHGGYEYHSDDAAVDAFAWAMRDKMEESREKGRSGWDSPFQCSPYRLAEMLIDHIAKGDPVDVGNFAMMLFNRPDARGVLARVWSQRLAALATPSPGKAQEPLPVPVATLVVTHGATSTKYEHRLPDGEYTLYASPGKAEAERWQPIETAPKDREVWAFNGEQGRMQWSEGSADNGEGWALWVWCDQLLSDADPEPEQPSHWMPLPAAPAADAEIFEEKS